MSTIVYLAAACTVDGPSNEFGVPVGMTVAPTTSPTGGSDTGDGESSSGSEGSGGSEGSSGGDGSTSGMPGTTTGSPMDGSSTGGGGATEQPASGMYSDCVLPADCIAPSNLCLTVNMTDGFCTNMGCVNAAVDCDPSPGGTSVPICFPIPVDKIPQDSCALDCAGGLTCPLGMACVVLADGSICA